MTDAVHDQWEKELRVLLRTIEQHPERDLTVERERVAILRQLLAKPAHAQA